MSIDVRSELISKIKKDPMEIYNIELMDLNISYCGDNCILKELPTASGIKLIPLSVSKNMNIGLLDSNAKLLYTNLPDVGWAENHMYGMPVARNKHQSKRVVELIQKNPHDTLANVTGVCNCAYRVRYIEGKPIENNFWSGIFTKSEHEDSYNFFQVKKIIITLIQGLKHLHSLGIAHTDPVLSNVYKDDKGSVYWIDLGEAVPITPETLMLDLVVFYHLTLIPLINNFEKNSSILFPKLHQAFEDSTVTNLLDRIEEIIEKHSVVDEERNEDVLVNYLKENREDNTERLKLHLTKNILHRGFLIYKKISYKTTESSNAYEGMLKSEIHRGMLLAREMERTNKEKQNWFLEVEKAKSWLEEQYNNWKHVAEDLEKKRIENEIQIDLLCKKNEDLLERNKILEGQIEQLKQHVAEIDLLCKKNEDLLERNKILEGQIEQLKHELASRDAQLWNKIGRFFRGKK